MIKKDVASTRSCGFHISVGVHLLLPLNVCSSCLAELIMDVYILEALALDCLFDIWGRTTSEAFLAGLKEGLRLLQFRIELDIYDHTTAIARTTVAAG
jgi:hypothetical protein